jgi:hypothetical protein
MSATSKNSRLKFDFVISPPANIAPALEPSCQWDQLDHSLEGLGLWVREDGPV